MDGGEPRPISGIAKGDVPVQWTPDGRSLYVRRWDEMPARVFRLDLGTGRRELWKQIMPADHTGVIEIRGILPTPDGRAYAYSYLRSLGIVRGGRAEIATQTRKLIPVKKPGLMTSD